MRRAAPRGAQPYVLLRDKSNHVVVCEYAPDFDKISKQIIAQLTIPGTDPYKHKFPDGTRLVVNKEQPENRLARTAAEKSASNLPATDIKERWGSCAVV